MGTRWTETCWATYKEQLIRRNKYNTKWHLVGFLFHVDCIFIIVYWTVEAGEEEEEEEEEYDDDDDDDGDKRKVYFANGFVILLPFRKELSGERS